MPRVLVTAFGPYGVWEENASWQAMIELTRKLPSSPQVTTRLYPVDFDVVRERLEKDLRGGFDYALHLGQAPGAASILLETIGLNVRGAPLTDLNQPQSLVPNAPVAYQSDLPVAFWAQRLREAGIPARVSYHAGTYLCNATLYLTHYLCEQHGWRTRAAFAHVPLTCAQIFTQEKELPSMPSQFVADAIRLILEELVEDHARHEAI